jgi:uncharacterized phage protein gp47/JayE
MISEAVFLLILILTIALAAASLLNAVEDIVRVVSAITAAVLMWISALLFASGSVGTQLPVITTETLSGNVTSYTYEVMQIPLQDNAVAVMCTAFALALTMWSIVITTLYFTRAASAGEEDDDEIDE